MKKLALAAAVAVLAVAASAQDAASSQAGDPMAGWTPPKIKAADKDRKEILQVMRRWEAAAMKGDVQAAAALVDFPVLMVTDTKAGEAMGDGWTRERWLEVMGPMYKPMGPDFKMTHKPTIFLVSDSLASLADEATITMGGRKVTSRSHVLLVRKGGEWKVKAMTEGGWGDMMATGGGSSGAAGGSGGASGAMGGATDGGASMGGMDAGGSMGGATGGMDAGGAMAGMDGGAMRGGMDAGGSMGGSMGGGMDAGMGASGSRADAGATSR